MDGVFAWEMIHEKRYYQMLAKYTTKRFAGAAAPTRTPRLPGVQKGKDN
jgi:hypothetical protein